MALIDPLERTRMSLCLHLCMHHGDHAINGTNPNVRFNPKRKHLSYLVSQGAISNNDSCKDGDQIGAEAHHAVVRPTSDKEVLSLCAGRHQDTVEYATTIDDSKIEELTAPLRDTNFGSF